MIERSLGGWALALALAACGPDAAPCDGDQRYDRGLCYEPDDAAVDAASHFGDPCSAAAGCAAPTTYCVVPASGAAGYCTRTGCLTEPTLCPTGWVCVDLAVVQAGLPSICAR